MSGYDIIGDVHGCADQLESMLHELGYRVDPDTGAYRHDRRSAIFVGDLIDRGSSQLRVVQIAKAMADVGSAQVIMGNHEFNAVSYATRDPDEPDRYLRVHSDKNRDQHSAFLTQLSPEEQAFCIDWFRTLPLWLELDGLRVVHACWHQPSIDALTEILGGDRFVTTEQWVRASRRGDPVYDAIEVVLKGPEVDLREYGAPDYRDGAGHQRRNARIAWWRSDAHDLADLVTLPDNVKGIDGLPYGPLPDVRLNDEDRSWAYRSETPVVYGHYWRVGVPHEHEDWTATTACVDFSAINGGTLVAYQWDGEPQIDPRHYHPHGVDIAEAQPSV